MRHIKGLRIGSGVFLLACVCCSPPPRQDTRPADVRTLTEREALWDRQWRLRDAERITSNYSDDATLMLPNRAPATGHENIREAIKDVFRDGNFALSFDSGHVEVSRSGDYGYVQGAYTLTSTDMATKRQATDQGSYLHVYRKQMDGGWRVVQDMRISRLPGGPALDP